MTRFRTMAMNRAAPTRSPMLSSKWAVDEWGIRCGRCASAPQRGVATRSLADEARAEGGDFRRRDRDDDQGLVGPALRITVGVDPARTRSRDRPAVRLLFAER